MKKAFSIRLQTARREAGYRALKDFALAIGESVATCTSWEHRGSEPRYDTLIKICSTLNCTADYLLGLSDTPHPHSISQVASHSPHSNQVAGNCANCPFADSYRTMANALTTIALRDRQ